MTLDLLWRTPPPDPDLGENTVHVWRAALDLPTTRLRELARLCSPEEHTRAARFHFDLHRTRFLAGRGILRALLGAYLAFEPGAVRFAYGPYGKPSLAADGTTLQFNVAHSEGLFLCAVARDLPVGIDVEWIRPVPEMARVAARSFSPREYASWYTLPDDQKLQAFYSCWTRKEAFLKVTAEGLARPLSSFDLSLAPNEPARLLWVEGEPDAPSRFGLESLQPAAGATGALAVEAPAWSLICWHWPEQG